MKLRLTARGDLKVQTPEFIGPGGRCPRGKTYATTGIGPDLYVAAQEAIQRMIDYVTRSYDCAPETAYMLGSVLVDLRISEIVDQPNWVVSAFWPQDDIHPAASRAS